jgi:hypothetical protein
MPATLNMKQWTAALSLTLVTASLGCGARRTTAPVQPGDWYFLKLETPGLVKSYRCVKANTVFEATLDSPAAFARVLQETNTPYTTDDITSPNGGPPEGVLFTVSGTTSIAAVPAGEGKPQSIVIYLRGHENCVSFSEQLNKRLLNKAKNYE